MLMKDPCFCLKNLCDVTFSVNTLRPKQNRRHFAEDTALQMHFLKAKASNFDQNLSEICSCGTDQQQISMSSNDGF